MNVSDLDALLDVAKRKHTFDKTNEWCKGSTTYIEQLSKEIAEVKEELPLNRTAHLEEELGDVMWVYLNMILWLDCEGKIDKDRLFERARAKFDERTSGIENGELWADIKQRQKNRLNSV